MGQEDWDKVEKKLEDGDLPELLVSEDKIAMDEYDRRRGQGLQPPEEEVALKCVAFLLLCFTFLVFCARARAPLPYPDAPLRRPAPAGRATSGCATRRPCPAPR